MRYNGITSSRSSSSNSSGGSGTSGGCGDRDVNGGCATSTTYISLLSVVCYNSIPFPFISLSCHSFPLNQYLADPLPPSAALLSPPHHALPITCLPRGLQRACQASNLPPPPVSVGSFRTCVGVNSSLIFKENITKGIRSFLLALSLGKPIIVL